MKINLRTPIVLGSFFVPSALIRVTHFVWGLEVTQDMAIASAATSMFLGTMAMIVTGVTLYTSKFDDKFVWDLSRNTGER